MSQTNQVEAAVLSDEIRDGLLQDLLAVSMILRDLETKATPAEAERLGLAREAINADITTVRELVGRLSAAGDVAA